MKVAMLVFNDMRSDARVDREASALALAGHDVVVLALTGPDLADLESRPTYLVKRVSALSTSSWRSPLRKLQERRSRSRAFVAALREASPDVVHCHDADTLEAGMDYVASTRCMLVYDAHELFVDMIAVKGRPALVQRHWRRIEARAIERADALITVSPAIAELLEQRHARRFTVLRNVSPLQPLARTGRLRRELCLAKDALIVLYQGGLLVGRGLGTAVRAMTGVPHAHLVIQGSGPDEIEIRRAVAECDLEDRVHLMGHVPSDSLHEYACDADVGLVILEHTSLNNYLAAPNKLYSYLMAGLPIAASAFPNLTDVVQGLSVGTTFDPAEDQSITAALVALIGDAESRSTMGERARAAAEGEYNWEKESGRLMDLYGDLGTTGRAR